MGGDTTIEQPQTPTAPSPTATSREAIQAQINALPEILQAQQQFGPQFSQQQLESLQQFGPEFAQTALDLQRQFGPQFAEVERQLSPELAGAQDELARFFEGTDQDEFERLLPNLQEGVRAAQSQRGLGDISPLGSIDESVQVQQLRETLKNRRLNAALSTAGRVPISGVPQVQGQSGVGQLIQNVNPQSIFNAQASNNSFNQGVFGTQSSNFQNQPGSILGQIAGGLGGAAVGGLGGFGGAGLAGGLGGLLPGGGGFASGFQSVFK